MRKRLLILILGICLVASLVGCGSKKDRGVSVESVITGIQFDSDTLSSFKEKIGNTTETTTEQNEYTFDNMSFIGINGKITVSTNQNDTIHHCTWTSEKGKSSEYGKLKEYFDNNYTFSNNNAIGAIYKNGDVRFLIASFDDDKTVSIDIWKFKDK